MWYPLCINDDMEEKIDDILELDEMMRDYVARNGKLKLRVKYLYEKMETYRKFKVYDMVLL